MPEKTVQVFVCTEFEDMQAERDVLVRLVFPELGRKCGERGVRLVDVDLNWGVAEVPTDYRSILRVIDSELNRSQIVLAVVGERFGRVPPGEYDSLFALEIYTALASASTELIVLRREPMHNLDLEQDKLLRRLDFLQVEQTPYKGTDDFAARARDLLFRVLSDGVLKKHGFVFLSYSRTDSESAERLKRALEGADFEVWLDRSGIGLGDDWPERLATGINESDAVLMLLSRHSVQSEYTLKEIVFALKKRKPVLALELQPVQLPDKVELMLGNVQRIRLGDFDTFEAAVEEIGRGIRKCASAK